MKTKTKALAFLRARGREELEQPWQRGLLTAWNLAALLLSSLGTTVLSLALAVGTDTDEADGRVTIRERDSMEQVRIPISEVKAWLSERVKF